MIERVRSSDITSFFGALRRADPRLATAWWVLLVLSGALPAALVVTMGILVRAVEGGRPLGGPLTAVGVVFVAMQVIRPLHAQVGMSLGDSLSAWLNDHLLRA